MPITAGTTIAVNTLLAISGNVVKAATSTNNILNIVAVSAESADSSATTILATLINDNQIWEADCANNTNSNQLLVGQNMGNNGLINNLSTESGNNGEIFLPFAIKGSTSDKKLLGKLLIERSTTGL